MKKEQAKMVLKKKDLREKKYQKNQKSLRRLRFQSNFLDHTLLYPTQLL